jgi:hypothetical protein
MIYGTVALKLEGDHLKIFTGKPDGIEQPGKDNYEPELSGTLFNYPADLITEEEAAEKLIATRLEELDKTIRLYEIEKKLTAEALEWYKDHKDEEEKEFQERLRGHKYPNSE